MEEIGEFLGWVLFISTAFAIMTYIIKYIAKNYMQQVSKVKNGKEILKYGQKIFVRYHKYFGICAFIFLVLHFIVQNNNEPFNLSGYIAGGILLIQILLGIYALIFKKQRKGLWFNAHRIIAVLIVLFVGLHLIFKF